MLRARSALREFCGRQSGGRFMDPAKTGQSIFQKETPDASQGVPSASVKGYQPPEQAQPPTQRAQSAEPKPESNPKPKSKAKPKPKPKPEIVAGVKTAAERTSEWFRKHLWKLVFGLLLTVAGGIADRFSDELNAWLRSVFVGGIGGTYVLKTFTYPDQTDPVSLTPASATIELKDGGGTVFGTIKSNISGAEYRLFGYHRVKFLLMSYGGKGPLGGTIALQSDVASEQSSVFWGWRTYVECIGAPSPQSFLVECPAIMFLQGTHNPEEGYNDFLRVDYCRKVTSHNLPELCDDLKRRK